MTRRWVLLDCDGLLADSETISARTLTAQLHACGVDLAESEVRCRFIGRSRRAVSRTLRETHGFTASTAFWETYHTRRDVVLRTELQPVPGALAFLTALRARGWCLAVATDAGRGKTERSLLTLKLASLIDGPILCAEELGVTKRQSEYFVRAARRLGCDTAALSHVDDRCFAIASARRAGLSAVGYIGPGSSSCRADFARMDAPLGNSLAEVERHLAELRRA